MIHRAFRYRLDPTQEQESQLRQSAGVTRLVYNLALEQRRDFWRPYLKATGGWLNFASQGREVTALRAAVDWIGAVPCVCLAQALRDLDRAFANFRAGRAGFPTPRRKGRNDSFRLQARDVGFRRINRRWSAIRLSKIGWIKFRDTRPIVGRRQSVTVSHDALGWHIAVACEIDCEIPANDCPPVGIDRGIATTLALSNGQVIQLPDMTAIEAQRRRAQRVLARRKKGSRRRLKQLKRVARLSARIARIRKDWQHRASTDIASRFGAVTLENLKIGNMTASGGRRKRGLNRSILSQGWGELAALLAYKLQERGGTLTLVNPAFTSQTCSDCGATDRESRKSQASFVCTNCGFALNADHNAAINILRRSTPLTPVEGCGYAPDEAGTMREAA